MIPFAPSPGYWVHICLGHYERLDNWRTLLVQNADSNIRNVPGVHSWESLSSLFLMPFRTVAARKWTTITLRHTTQQCGKSLLHYLEFLGRFLISKVFCMGWSPHITEWMKLHATVKRYGSRDTVADRSCRKQFTRCRQKKKNSSIGC